MPAKTAATKAKAPVRKTTSAKAAAKKKAKTAPVQNPQSVPPEAVVATTDECPRGGDHEWKEEDGERFCGKCLGPAEARSGKKVKEKADAAKDDAPASEPAPDETKKPAPARSKKAKPTAQAKEKKLSAIDAAANVLAESNQPMNAKEMIEAMAAKKLWTSPGGATPHATLYSAILREISNKGKEARFKKTERGRFAANA